MLLAPAFTAFDNVSDALRNRGYAVLSAETLCRLAHCELAQLRELSPSWGGLPPDNYLKDGGHYRKRRHSSFIVEDDVVTAAPHRAHWQSVEYNALHGGMQRWFEPIAPPVAQSQGLRQLLLGLGGLASALKRPQPWFVEAHQFRIDTEGGIGRPTPEGAHRDGVDLVAVFLVAREGIKGGETRVFQADGPAGERFTLTEPWSVLLLDDERVIHESTPIQPSQTRPESQSQAQSPQARGHRDTLVVTYRAGSFQGA